MQWHDKIYNNTYRYYASILVLKSTLHMLMKNKQTDKRTRRGKEYSEFDLKFRCTRTKFIQYFNADYEYLCLG